VRIHFSVPKELYIHPVTGAEFPFYTGNRVWVPPHGDRSGTYLEIGKESVFDAYKNPKKYGLELKSISWINKLNDKVYYAVTGWVEEWFHLVEKKSKKDSSKTFKEREICTGRGCEHCKKDIPKLYGKKIYMPVARTHWNDSIYAVEEKAASMCKCSKEGFIYTTHYACSGCEATLIDMSSACYSCDSEELEIDPDKGLITCSECSAEWSVYESENKEISKAVNEELTCSECDVTDFPVPVTVCTECGEEADPYSVFDCRLKLKMTASSDGRAKDLVVSDWEIRKPDPRLFDPKFQGNDDMAVKIAEGMNTPINLTHQLSPLSLEDEAEKLGLPNPFVDGGSGGKGYKSYRRDDKGDEDDNEEGDGGVEDAEYEEVEEKPRKKKKFGGRPRLNR
jgi:hypothetical protein